MGHTAAGHRCPGRRFRFRAASGSRYPVDTHPPVMPSGRRVVSYLLLWHLTAVILGFVPQPGSVPAVDPARRAIDDPVAARVTPVLDRAAMALVRLPPVVWGAGRQLLLVAHAYLRLVGLGQQWSMFWIPPMQDQYVRLRYFVGPDGRGDRPSWTAMQLVFPVIHDDEPRLIRSYWAKPRDKAVFAALSAFLESRAQGLVRRDTRPEELPQDLTPVLRYFTREFEREYLVDGERVLRSEVWFGVADVPPRGSRTEQGVVEQRLRTLHVYYEGPIENRLRVPEYPPYHASAREADIHWVLEYFEGE